MQSTPQPPAPVPPNAIVVVDTSVWISTLLPTDSNHRPARTWIDQHLLNDGTLIAPVLMVTEVAAALCRQTGRPAIAHRTVTRLYNLPGMSFVPVDQPLIDIATDLAADLGIRGADALFVALAKQLGIPLVTFDAEQIRRPAGIIPTIRP